MATPVATMSLQLIPEMSLQLIPEKPTEWDAFLEETEAPALAFSWWVLFSCQTLLQQRGELSRALKCLGNGEFVSWECF